MNRNRDQSNILQHDPTTTRDKRVLLINMALSGVVGAVLSVFISAVVALSFSGKGYAKISGASIVIAGAALLHRTLALASPGNRWMILTVRLGSAVSVFAGALVVVSGFEKGHVNYPYSAFIIFAGVAFLCASVVCEIYNTLCEIQNPVFVGNLAGTGVHEEGTTSRWSVLGNSPHNQLSLRQVGAIALSSVYFAFEHVALMGILGISSVENISSLEIAFGAGLGLLLGCVLGVANVESRRNMAFEATFTPL